MLKNINTTAQTQFEEPGMEYAARQQSKIKRQQRNSRKSKRTYRAKEFSIKKQPIANKDLLELITQKPK